MKSIPLLIDFDGVIRLGNKPAPDTAEFFNFIKKENIPAFVISNSTLKTSEEIKDFFESFDIPFELPAMTAAEITLKYVSDNYKRIKVYCTEHIKKLFNEFIVEVNPEAVVVGDLEDKWSYDILNEIFREVYAGADFITMQKNKFWKPDGNALCLDAGSFVSAIEYASSKKALLIGKPSTIYFQTVLKIAHPQTPSQREGIFKDALSFGEGLGEAFYMLGDDLETDIIGAQKAGGKGILIYTGKTPYPLDKNSDVKPDYEVKNLSEAIKLLSSL